MRQVLVVFAVLLASACGSAEPSVSPDDLFMEYARSTTVKNDLLAHGATKSEDRLATLASRYSGGELRGALLFAYECNDNKPAPDWHTKRCRRSSVVDRAAGGGTMFARSVIVKHGDGSLELVTLYVAQSPGRSVLLDGTGRTYTDLENFRATNELFATDDTLLTVRNIAVAPGGGDLITVTGRTSPTWYWWWLGGLLVVVAALGVVIVVAGRSHQRRLTAHLRNDA
ncbi:hypothetical protein LFM09_37275 [Lentzea alba]|uniref:hypothetical protein n=1 Tax=Lentzea alba TaxID=2714351 RepID=UPI0039BF04C8